MKIVMIKTAKFKKSKLSWFNPEIKNFEESQTCIPLLGSGNGSEVSEPPNAQKLNFSQLQ